MVLPLESASSEAILYRIYTPPSYTNLPQYPVSHNLAGDICPLLQGDGSSDGK